jgi:hypothetical protein
MYAEKEKALFSNFVAFEYKIGMNHQYSLVKLTLLMRKEHANLIPTCKMGIYDVKIGFWILTTIFTKTAKKKNKASRQIKLPACFIYAFSCRSTIGAINLAPNY